MKQEPHIYKIINLWQIRICLKYPENNVTIFAMKILTIFVGNILTIFLWKVDCVLQKKFTIFAEKFNDFWKKI